jgi:hypothetical protein
MPNYYVARKDNPLTIKSYGHAQPNHYHFDVALYEEHEGALPEGWSLEPPPKSVDDVLQALRGLFQGLSLAVQYQHTATMAAIESAALSGNLPLMRYSIEQLGIDPDFKAALLACF